MIDFLQSFGLLFITIVILSFLIKLLKQPIIIGYVLSGLLFTTFSQFINYNITGQQIIIMSELGITFLLFLMGIEFDLKNLKYLGKDVLIATIWQSVILFCVAFGLSMLFSFTWMERIYLSILFMFSSTLLVAKWLEDKRDTTALYGKITINTLIIQDIIAIIAITVLGVVQVHNIVSIVLAPLGGVVLVAIAFVLARYVLNKLLKIASRYAELLFIFSLSICFLFVEIAPWLGYSMTIGAFIAGITLANTMYKNDIILRLKPLIVFFNMLFFVGLGFQMNLHMSLDMALFIIVLTILALLLKPFVVYFTLRHRGYDSKTSFLAGLHLSQLSEFGIIILGAGALSGAISGGMNSVAIIAVILTMILSSYLIKYAEPIYAMWEKHLRKIDKYFITREVKLESASKIDCNVLFFGYYDISKELLAKMQATGKKMLVVEKDPESIDILKKQGIQCVYNSVDNPGFLDEIDFKKVELVVSSLLLLNDNRRIVQHLKEHNPNGVAILTAKTLKDSLALYNAGADYVLYSYHLNEMQVSVLLEEYTTDINKVINKKLTEFAKLKEKEEQLKLHEDANELADIAAFFKRISSGKSLYPPVVEKKDDKETKEGKDGKPGKGAPKEKKPKSEGKPKEDAVLPPTPMTPEAQHESAGSS